MRWSGAQLVEQHLGLLQIERVEAFGKPAIDRSENIAGFIPLALIAQGGSENSRSVMGITKRLRPEPGENSVRS